MGLGAASALASLILAAWVLQKEIPLSAREAQPELKSRKWLSSAVPMALTNGMHILLGNTSLLLLGVFSTAAAVGIFRVATSLALLIGLPISLFNMISGPILSRIHAQQNLEAMQYVLAWLAAGMSIGTAVITLPVLVYGGELVDFAFGSEFLAANYPLQILCVGMLLCSALGSNVIVLNMCGHEKRVTRAFGIALAFLAVAGIPLIHFYGLAGAAIANAGSMLLWNVMLFLDAKRLLDMDTSLMAPLRNPRILIQHHGANPQ
jgi:O-antigen/teichoic acid export membrane protein